MIYEITDRTNSIRKIRLFTGKNTSGTTHYRVTGTINKKHIDKKFSHKQNAENFIKELHLEETKNKIPTPKLNIKKYKNFKKYFVYLMKDKFTGYYKIGRSAEPKYRERTLQSEKPTIELVFSTAETKKINEKLLHAKYKDQQVRGEWFDLSPAQVRCICKNRSRIFFGLR